MVETLRRSSRKELERTGLYSFARNAKKRYFISEIRQEKQGDADPFDVVEVISRTTLAAVEEFLNKTLDAGGEVAVIDLTKESPIRVYALTKKHYAKFILPPDPYQSRVEENRTDDFTILLSGSVIPGSPSLFLNIEGDKFSDDISWQEHEQANLRFAILSHQKGIWEAVLDFRIDSGEGEPSWKVNASVLDN